MCRAVMARTGIAPEGDPAGSRCGAPRTTSIYIQTGQVTTLRRSRSNLQRYPNEMGQPSLNFTSVSVAAPDPRKLAEFYSELLGLPITSSEPPHPGAPPEDGWAQIRPPKGKSGPTLNFEYEPDHVRPVWPSVEGGQQLQTHLDLAVDDMQAAVSWAEGVGAVLADFQPQDHVRVMLDPGWSSFLLVPAELASRACARGPGQPRCSRTWRPSSTASPAPSTRARSCRS